MSSSSVKKPRKRKSSASVVDAAAASAAADDRLFAIDLEATMLAAEYAFEKRRPASPPPIYIEPIIPFEILESFRPQTPGWRVAHANTRWDDVGGSLRQRNPTVFDDRVRFVERSHSYYLHQPDGSYATNSLVMSVSKIWTRMKKKFDSETALNASTAVSAKNVRALGDAVASYARTASVSSDGGIHQLVSVFGTTAAPKLAASSDFHQLVRGAAVPLSTHQHHHAGARGGGGGIHQLVGGSSSGTGVPQPRYETQAIAQALARTYRKTLGEKFGPLTPRNVRVAWKRNGNEAAAMGTRAHAQFEAFFNGEPFTYPDLPEVTDVLPQLIRDYPELDPRLAYRTELSMVYEPLLITGQLDYLAHSARKPGAFVLIDWKRIACPGKRETIAPDYRKAFPDVDSRKVSTYFGQINIYRWMLENEGYEIDEAAIFIIHPDHQGPRKIIVPRMPRETQWLIERHVERVLGILRRGVDEAPHAESDREEEEEEGDLI